MGLHKTLKSSPISQKATNSTLHFYNTIKPEQFTEPKFPYNGIFVGADAKVILTVPPWKCRTGATFAENVTAVLVWVYCCGWGWLCTIFCLTSSSGGVKIGGGNHQELNNNKKLELVSAADVCSNGSKLLFSNVSAWFPSNWSFVSEISALLSGKLLSLGKKLE